MKGPPDIAQLCLGHKTGVELKDDHGSRTVITRWALYPLNGVRRPDSGTQNVTVICGECRKSIRLTVDSEQVATTKQLRKLMWRRVCGVIMLGLAMTAILLSLTRAHAGLADVLALAAVIPGIAWVCLRNHAKTINGVLVVPAVNVPRLELKDHEIRLRPQRIVGSENPAPGKSRSGQVGAR